MLGKHSCYHYTMSLITYILINVAIKAKSPGRSKAKRTPHSRPPPPFSVSIKDAMTNRHLMVLSVIQITPAWCPPHVQRIIKDIKFTERDKYLHKVHDRRQKYKGYRFLLFPLLYFITYAPSAHAIPGTNHFIIKE